MHGPCLRLSKPCRWLGKLCAFAALRDTYTICMALRVSASLRENPAVDLLDILA